MTGIITPQWMVCELHSDFVSPAASFSVSTAEHRFTVPAGKRWFLIGGITVRDANETLAINIYDGTNLVLPLVSAAAGTGTHTYPTNVAGAINLAVSGYIVLDAGWYIRIVFGGAQGAGASVSVQALEIDI